MFMYRYIVLYYIAVIYMHIHMYGDKNKLIFIIMAVLTNKNTKSTIPKFRDWNLKLWGSRKFSAAKKISYLKMQPTNYDAKSEKKRKSGSVVSLFNILYYIGLL